MRFEFYFLHIIARFSFHLVLGMCYPLPARWSCTPTLSVRNYVTLYIEQLKEASSITIKSRSPASA